MEFAKKARGDPWEVVFEVWGDLACFCPPYSRVERATYPFPTPSAARGILSSVYMKPPEFTWQITRIEVLNEIRYISFKCNEIKCTTNYMPIAADENRTQRQTVALRDVHYRIAATIKPRDKHYGQEARYYEQAMRRIQHGKCFYQPSLGLRSFTGYFGPADYSHHPIAHSMDAGLMVYDIFDQMESGVQKTTKPILSLYHAEMKDGVVLVPPYDSPDVLKGFMEGGIC